MKFSKKDRKIMGMAAGILAAAGLFCGCTMTLAPAKPGDPLPRIRQMDADAVAEEIRSLEKGYPHLDDPAERAKQMLKLSLLYAHPENPNPEYGGARDLIEKSRELVPEGEQPVFRYVDLLLKSLRQKEETVRLLHKDIRVLEDQVEKIRGQKQSLQVEKARLERVLEELKKLDVEIERHRQEALDPGGEGEK